MRTTHADGSVTVTNAIGVPLLPGAPGIFAADGNEPRAGQVYHASSFATGIIILNAGTIQAGDAGTITIGDRPYTYTVLATDTLFSIRDAFINLINSDTEGSVTASAAPIGFAVQLTAKIPGTHRQRDRDRGQRHDERNQHQRCAAHAHGDQHGHVLRERRQPSGHAAESGTAWRDYLLFRDRSWPGMHAGGPQHRQSS